MDDTPVMSIGALSRAVGLTEGTLRNWERRYGYPKPERTPGGHRVYRQEAVTFLKLVCGAMRSGHRPAQLLKMNATQLEAIVHRHGQVVRLPAPSASQPLEQGFLGAVRRFDSKLLFSTFRSRVAKVGLLRFVQEDATDLLRNIGVAWEQGELEIEHEHFASEILRDFLTSEWRMLNGTAGGPRVVCCTLAGEQHGLGLHLAACCLAASGYQVLFLGTDLPASAIAAAVQEHNAVAVAVSMSAFSDASNNETMLRDLRAGLDPRVELWTGGGGAEELSLGPATFSDLPGFCVFLAERLNELRSRSHEAL
jgi:methylmalonyl-CoA mutase cobalamin-binding subunit